MSLDLLKIRRTSSTYKGVMYMSSEFVPASYVVARLAESCPECIEAAYVEWQGITLDEATYAVDEGLIVECGGKRFRLNVTAEELGDVDSEGTESAGKE